MDMATAAYAWFGLLEAKAAGRPIPGDVAMNAEGQATTDPNEVLQGGAIRVFDKSYKVGGYGRGPWGGGCKYQRQPNENQRPAEHWREWAPDGGESVSRGGEAAQGRMAGAGMAWGCAKSAGVRVAGDAIETCL